MGPLVLLQDYNLSLDGERRECIKDEIVPWLPEAEGLKLLKAGVVGQAKSPATGKLQKDVELDLPQE